MQEKESFCIQIDGTFVSSVPKCSNITWDVRWLNGSWPIMCTVYDERWSSNVQYDIFRSYLYIYIIVHHSFRIQECISFLILIN